nr:ABC transporter permease [Bacteroidales bacterium]
TFYLTFLGQGVPSDLPTGVVDLDNSSLSRNFTSQLDATQLGKVIHFETFSEARDAMQKGEINGFCVLPENLFADVQTQKQPKITFYTNGLYFLGGTLVYRNLLTMVNLTSGAVHREVLRMKGLDDGTIGNLRRPVDIDVHMIGNPTMDYGAYLATTLLPGMLQMVIIILIIYSFGAELKYGTSRHLLRTAGGRMRNAIMGKLLMYTLYFAAIGIALEVILYSWMKFPLAGNLGNMFIDILLLVLASESVGLFIIGLFPVTRFALSIGALYSILSISLSGFTLPLETAPAYVQGFGEIVPLRHYYQFAVQETIFGSGFAGWYKEAIDMLIFLFLPYTTHLRLKKAYIYQNYPKN